MPTSHRPISRPARLRWLVAVIIDIPRPAPTGLAARACVAWCSDAGESHTAARGAAPSSR